MRTFVRLSRMLASYAELADRLEQLEGKYDQQFRVVFEAIRQMRDEPASQESKIGFKIEETVGGLQLS